MRMVGRFCGYTRNPGIAASFGRRSSMIWSADGRSSRGLSRMKMRPVFGTTLIVEAPIDDMSWSTYGLLRTIAAAARCFSAIASNEMSCEASVNAKIWPVSSVGNETLGDDARNSHDREHEGRDHHGHRADADGASVHRSDRSYVRSIPSKKRSDAM